LAGYSGLGFDPCELLSPIDPDANSSEMPVAAACCAICFYNDTAAWLFKSTDENKT
jgi:hypothetical protein